ncbi:CBL-interacting serine/threonine-protein kinase 25-like [Chenopodium quinoa]|uniref:non-specific serine/threonine protein kinase n=1 Tax=Chenopodium quinoa TaxID=63459 RepID=A0A803MC02_CHEQI|nr:CBL-interacting serine/threonine-protein kinase 25-like [Chenopodium quinoa]
MDRHIDEHHECESQTPTRNIIFGKYEVGRLLGQGTFAKVYYGKNDATNENVAIKVISKEQVRKAGMVEAIEREISVMRLVRHPNVVGLKEVLATKGRIYFIMEYVKGGELFSKIAKGRLKEEYARKYFQQLISAIDYCHSRGVSHRDLKPENLLLDENENLKVTDFGLSALPEHLRHDGLLHTQCGTPAYVAPEVLTKKGYDGAKADIWSCGVILFALLSGYLPFQDVNMMKMYRKIFKGEYEFPPWFPPDGKRLVSKLLVVDPNRRLSIQGIMRQPWFRKDPLSSYLPQPLQVPDHQDPKVASPRFFNAFEFISSMSSGFDLSSLFENNKKSGSMFTSKCSASAIMAKFEGLAKKLNLQVSSKEFKLKMQGREEGRKGRLLMTAEVFEVAAEVTVVEFSKCSGDTLEYVKFCEEDVRPALKDIVWSWQGETNCQLNCNS